MSRCEHHIMSHGSFGWWTAMLATFRDCSDRQEWYRCKQGKAVYPLYAVWAGELLRGAWEGHGIWGPVLLTFFWIWMASTVCTFVNLLKFIKLLVQILCSFSFFTWMRKQGVGDYLLSVCPPLRISIFCQMIFFFIRTTLYCWINWSFLWATLSNGRKKCLMICLEPFLNLRITNGCEVTRTKEMLFK